MEHEITKAYEQTTPKTECGNQIFSEEHYLAVKITLKKYSYQFWNDNTTVLPQNPYSILYLII